MTWAGAMLTAPRRKEAKIEVRTMKSETELRGDGENVQRPTSDAESPTPETVSHLYVHVPFCARICPYCAFYKTLADSSQTRRFCEALLRETEDLAQRFFIRPETIFLGGGSPPALNPALRGFLLDGFRERLDLSGLREWTVEANPGSVSPRKAKLLRAAGVNRVSLGVQSWDNELLKLLGREHDAAQAETSFHILREADFSNLSIDLMFGLPGQTLAQWETDLARTIAVRPQHISTYCLTYEEDTEFFVRHTRGEFREDPESDAQFLEQAMAMLEGAGYRHYEISNYSLPNFESAHNRGYWAGDDYLGIGPSAFSTVDVARWQNVCDYRAYADAVLTGASPVGSTETLTPEMKRTERIALGLRTRDGIPVRELQAWPAESDEFLKLGLMAEANGNFVLTPRGKLLADSVAVAFV